MGEDRRQRVMDALDLKIPDQVPFMYNVIHHSIREKLLGQKLTYEYPGPPDEMGPVVRLGEQSQLYPAETIDARVADLLGLDAIGMRFFPPLWVEAGEAENGVMIKDGLLKSAEDLEKVLLPDVDDERIYKPAEEFCRKYKGQYALNAQIRLGISFILNCMGLENFSYALADDPDFVKAAVEKYTDWVGRLITNLQECGFDFFWTFDDMAYKTSVMFSPAVWDEFFAPYLKKAASRFKIPWVFHSDGNLLPLMDKLLELGMNGIHPLEPGAMDVELLKHKYGDKVCLIGNIDINHTLTDASEEEVYRAVEERIRQLGPGGGYIISDSNSVPCYCNPRNILWMAEAVQKYRKIYGA